MTGYVDLTLAPGERIVTRGRWPWLYWLGAWIWLLAPAAAFIWSAIEVPLSRYIFLAFLCLGVFMFSRAAIRMKTTEFAVTDRRVVFKEGLLYRRTQEINVASIESVRLRQDVWGRLLSIGAIVVTGTGEAVIRLPAMADPVSFRRAIDSTRAQQR